MKKINYAKLPTEQPNPRSRRIDTLPIRKILDIINSEDASVPKAVGKVKKKITQGVELIVSSFHDGGRLFFAGAGTSGRLGIIEAAECPPTFNTRPSLVQAVMAGGKRAVFRSKEGAEDQLDEGFKIFCGKLKKQDILVGIAASGVTPFVQGALKAAKFKGAPTILIACNSTPSLNNLVDCLIAPKVGPEIITGSTRLKAGTATKLVLNMLTVTSMVRIGKVYQNWMVDLQPKSKKLTARALRIIQQLGGVTPEKADYYLQKANKKVKLAILMAKKGLDYSSASKKLKKTSGFLEKALAS
jgi:N-acetylmuramic acid 6-phosphate etherase